MDFKAAQSLLAKRVTFRKAPCLARCRGVKKGHATAVCFVSRTYPRLTLAPGVPKLRDLSRALTIQGNLQINPGSQGEGPFHSGPAATGRIQKMEDWDWLSAAGA